jgi:hypothetical protein
MQFYLTSLLLLILVNLCIVQQSADKKANVQTKATLDFITGLLKQGMFIPNCIIISICNIKNR